MPEDDDPNGKTVTITCHFENDPTGKVANLTDKRNVVIVAWYWLLIFTLLYIAKEVNRIAHFKREIFKHLEFYIDLVILLSFIFISPWADEWWRTGNMIGVWKNFEMPRWNYHVASIGGKNNNILSMTNFTPRVRNELQKNPTFSTIIFCPRASQSFCLNSSKRRCMQEVS